MRHLLLTLLIFTASASAHADSDPTLADYYGGEQASAYVIGSVGGAALAGGAYLLDTRATAFARSLGWTWIGFGGVEAVGAIVYTLQVHHEIHHYEALLAADPARYRATEIDHLRGVGARFVGYRLAELALVVGGGVAVGYGLAAHDDTAQGIGLGLATLALPLAVIDTLNNARAHRYLHTLEHVGVSPLDHGAAIALGGHF
jgi:hypothetical protein